MPLVAPQPTTPGLRARPPEAPHPPMRGFAQPAGPDTQSAHATIIDMRPATIAGLTATALGLILGFWPRHANGTNCGSALHQADIVPTVACRDAVSTLTYPTWILLVAGVALLIYSVAGRVTTPRR